MAQHTRPSKSSKFRPTIAHIEDSHDTTEKCTWKWEMNFAESKPTLGVLDLKHRVIPGLHFRVAHKPLGSHGMQLYILPWPRTNPTEERRIDIKPSGTPMRMTLGDYAHHVVEQAIEEILSKRVVKPIAG